VFLIGGRCARLHYEGRFMETLKLNHKLSHRKGKRRNAAKSVFLPVDITSEVASEVAALRDGNIEIALVNGLRITLNGDFDPGRVGQLVRGLTS
jgi:hypothetical protein|tara:strand:- start:2209 stop:2490 length:282 start_codon:yes stop_codon:yes gene_type:complete